MKKYLKQMFFLLTITLVIIYILSVGNFNIIDIHEYANRNIVLLLIFISTLILFRFTKFKRNSFIISIVIVLSLFIITSGFDKYIMKYSIENEGARIHIAKLCRKRIKGKSGVDGFYKFLNMQHEIKGVLPSEISVKININDTVILLESIKFRGQYHVLNYFPTSEDIKKAIAHKYYYKGEYVDTIP